MYAPVFNSIVVTSSNDRLHRSDSAKLITEKDVRTRAKVSVGEY